MLQQQGGGGCDALATLLVAAFVLAYQEPQRVKLATYLSKAAPKRGSRPGEHLLLVLDEPSTGLHFAELDMLLRAIYRLRAAGHTILCIEHNQGILSRADYLVELGPGSGAGGGRITYAGEPVQAPSTPTEAI